MNFEATGTKRKIQLSELDEWHEKTYHNSKIYKERTKRWLDKRIKKKEFSPGDKVLLFNSRVKTLEQMGMTIQGDKHIVAWSGNTSK